MDSYKFNREHSSKSSLLKPKLIFDHSSKQTNKNDKKIEKNTTAINKSLTEQQTHQHNRSKSKQKQKQKNKQNQVSFNDVVNKFKKLFDDKIKFVRDDTMPTTERIDITKQKKNYGTQIIPQAKVKKVQSHTILPKKKNTNNPGFSEIFSNIQANLNMRYKLKQKQKINESANNYFKSIDQNQKNENQQKMPFQIYYKQRLFSQKSKQKTNKSKQKIRNVSRTLSTKKNKIQRTYQFESIQQQQSKKQIKNRQRSKQKNKAQRLSANKLKKNNKNEKSMSSLTYRQRFTSPQMKDDIQQKNKNALKTLQSQKIGGQKKEKLNPSKKTTKNTKLKKNKNKQSKINLKQKSKIKNKTKQTQKSKDKLYNAQKISLKPNRIAIKLKPNQKINKFLTNYEKNEEDDKEINLGEEQLFSNNEHKKVSSSSDLIQQSEQSQLHSLQYFQGAVSDQQNLQKSKKIQKILGSVIQYDVGQQGQLKFHHKIIDSESEQQQQVQQILSGTKTWRDDSYDLISKYLLGFKQYINYKKLKLLLQQFHQTKIQKKKPYKLQNNQFPKFQTTPKKVQQQIQPKIYLKIQQTLKQEQQKWLSLKNNLQRIRKCDNFSQQLQKIIQEAELNHLAFKTMLIKDAKQIQGQKKKEIMSKEQEDRSEAQIIFKFQTMQVNSLSLEQIKYGQKQKVEIKEQVKQVKKEQDKDQDKGQTQGKEKNNYKQIIKKQQKFKQQQKYQQKEKQNQSQKQIIMHNIDTTTRPQISQHIKLIKNYNKIAPAQLLEQNEENSIQYLTNKNQISLNATLKSPPVRHQSINQINININIADADIKINSPFKKNTLQIKNEKYTEQNKLNKISIEVIKNQKQSTLNNNKTIIKKSQLQIQSKKPIEFLEDSLSSSQLSFQAFIEQCQKIQANKKNVINQNIKQIHTKQREEQQEFNNKIKQQQSYPQQDSIKTKRTNIQVPKLQLPKKSNIKTKLSYEEAPLQIKKILTNKSPSGSFEQKYKEKTKKMLISDLNLSQFISNKATDQSRDSSSHLQTKDKNSARVKILQQLRSPIHNSQLHHSINNFSSNSKNKSEQSIHSNTKLQQNNTINIANKQKISISLFTRDKNQQSSKSYKSQGNLQIIANNNNNKNKSKNFILFKSKKLSNQSDISEKQASRYGQNRQKLTQQLTSQNILDNVIQQPHNQQNSYTIPHTNIAPNFTKQQNIKINKLFQQSNSETLLIQTQYYNHNNNKQSQDHTNKNQTNNNNNDEQGYVQHEQHNVYNITDKQNKVNKQQQIKYEQQFIIRQESSQTKLHTILNTSNQSNQQIRQHIFQATQSRHNSSLPIYHSPQLQSSNNYTQPYNLVYRKQRQYILDNPIDMQSYNNQQNTFVKSPKQKYMLDKYYYCYQLITQQLLYEFIGQFARQAGTGQMRIVNYNRIGNKISQHYNINNINIIAQYNNYINEQYINKIQPNIYHNTVTISNTNSQLQVSPFTKIKKYTNTQQQQQYPQSTYSNSDAIHTISYYNPNQNIDINNGYQINDNIIATSIVNSSTKYILDYVHKLMQYICDDTRRLQQFKRKLSKPIGVSTLMMLQALRQNQAIQQQQDIPNNNCNINMNKNGNNQMYQDDKLALQLKQCFQADQAANQQQQFQIISLDMHSNFLRETQIQQYDNSNQQMFNHVIYDQINQILNDLRPFGHKGLPIFNFTHKPQNLQVIQSSKKYSPAYIHQYLNKQFSQLLSIRLGQYSYDIDSDRNISRSFNKMIQLFVLYLQQEFRNQNDADFEIKHELLLTLEFIIIQQEIRTIWQVMNRKLGNQ